MPTTPGPPPPLALPGLLDVTPLGRGPAADVHLGRQAHLERWVAAKVFRARLTGPGDAERFRDECRALGRLDQYPHVLTVHDAGMLPDGRPYLVSERCDGSLTDLLDARGPLPVAPVVETGLTMARALSFAHARGVVHGGVTPNNIRLRASGAPVLADFGMAVLRERRPPAAGGCHAAPEALRDGRADRAGDVFGLGSTLWTVLTGRPPFPARPPAPARPPTPPPGMPSWLAGLLVRMLAADPARRPTADEVVAALDAGGPPAAVPRPRTAARRLAAVATAVLVGGGLGGWGWVATDHGVPVTGPSPTAAEPEAAP